MKAKEHIHIWDFSKIKYLEKNIPKGISVTPTGILTCTSCKEKKKVPNEK